MYQNQHTTIYPIQRVASSYILDEAELAFRSDGSLWKLQQAVARARFDMLKTLIESDMVTIPGRDRVTVEIRIERSCVPVGVGDVPYIPQDISHVTTFTSFGAV